MPAALRLLLPALLVLAVGFGGATPLRAAIQTPTKTCTGPGNADTASIGETVTCRLTFTTDVADFPVGGRIIIFALANNYRFTDARACNTPLGTCTVESISTSTITLLCNSGDCTNPSVDETIVITGTDPDSVSQRISSNSTSSSITVSASPFRIISQGTALFVATNGDDTRNCQTRATACRTLTRALQVARDGDTIELLAGTYNVDQTIRVNKLVTIQPNSGAKVEIRARAGIVLFEVTAQGGPGLRVIIRNLTVGGNYQEGSSKAIFSLASDSYTEIANNIIGGVDIPINNGVVIANSFRPNIHDNTFQGATRSPFSPVLIVGTTVSGFGVASAECLLGAGATVSSNVQLMNNTFVGLWTAGVWLCSDGAGEHRIGTNVFRNYWRGIVLKDVTNTEVFDNTLAGGLSDGIIVYGASINNRIGRNQVESHVGVGAAGIRIGWVADPVMPSNNRVEENRILRNTIGIHVFGARSTRIARNVIKGTGVRTGVLLTPSTYLADPGTQPKDTEILENEIVFLGPCTPVLGCSIRLLGVTVPVLAINNDFGLRAPLDVEGVIWHRYDDEVVGIVTYVPFRNQVASPPEVTAAMPSPPPGTGGPTATSATGVGGQSVPIQYVPLAVGCTPMQWTGASGTLVADAAMAITPFIAQRRAVIWRRIAPGTWQTWSVEQPRLNDPVFTLNRGDSIITCVKQPATWMIVTDSGGP